MHKNTEIRNALQTILTDTATDATVYNSRLRALNDADLPAIGIYTNSETAEKTPDEAMLIRQVQVIIVCYVKGKDAIGNLDTGTSSVDVKLDDLMKYVQDKLLTKYETLNKTVYRFNFNGVTDIQAEPIGQNGIKLTGFLDFTARYHYEM